VLDVLTPFEISIAPCRGEVCVSRVALLENGNPIDAADLPFPTATQEAQQSSVGMPLGAGDPLQPGGTAKQWNTGAESAYVGISARLVRLSAGQSALVVDQVRGFEHLERAHVVFVAAGGKLLRVKQWVDGGGTIWSAVVVNGAEGQPTLAYLSVETTGTGMQGFRVTEHRWDDGGQKLVDGGLAEGRFWIVTAGRFPTKEAAEEARARQEQCLSAFWAVPSSGSPGFTLAAVTTRREYASGAAGRISGCLPGVTPTVERFSQAHRP
jgi:hypothetical protein